MPKIDIKRLQQIIQEEVSVLREGDDHKTGAKVMTATANLLTAVEAFKNNASEKAKSSTMKCIQDLENLLNMIVANPMNYVDTIKEPQFKKVTLKPAKTTKL